MNTAIKRALLVELIELMLYCGYDISHLVGRPFHYFDYDAVKKNIEIYKLEKQTIDN